MNYKYFSESQFRVSLFQYAEALTKGKNTYIKIKLNHTAKWMNARKIEAFIFFRDIE